MKLSIIITHYDEPWEIVRPLFDSIAMQRGIDFSEIEVILVNDGKEHTLDARYFEQYPFKTAVLAINKGGVSMARNFGLYTAKGDYVMFCDCDDVFLSAMGLHLIFKAIDRGYDAITSAFIEEQWVNGEYRIVRRDGDVTFVHGKVYRTQYLHDNKLHFNPKLTIHEDSYFNMLAVTLTENKHEITTPFYMWVFNERSVVRRDPENFVLKTYSHLMKCREELCGELEKRGEIDKYIDSVIKTIVDSYYDFNKPAYLDPKNKVLVEEAERAFKHFYEMYGHEYRDSNINRIKDIMHIARNQAYLNGLRIEQRTISDWLEHIVTEVR